MAMVDQSQTRPRRAKLASTRQHRKKPGRPARGARWRARQGDLLNWDGSLGHSTVNSAKRRSLQLAASHFANKCPTKDSGAPLARGTGGPARRGYSCNCLVCTYAPAEAHYLRPTARCTVMSESERASWFVAMAITVRVMWVSCLGTQPRHQF